MFHKYQHIERLGSPEVDGILIGNCWVFPKIDGTNGSIWFDGTVRCGSRNRDLSDGDDNHGFREWVNENRNKFYAFFLAYPNITLYGEWLVPHTLKTYRDDAWRNFYVFDVIVVVDDSATYVPYQDYFKTLDAFEISYIPPIAQITNPSEEMITGFLERNVYLIKDGCGTGEGVVVKNYGFKNQYGRVTWAKVVKNEFKEKHWHSEPTEVHAREQVELKIAQKYVTQELITKEIAKMGEWNSKMIPRLLSTIFYCVVKEEAWNFVKEHKNPKIDFRVLNQFVVQRIKELKPQLF